MVSVFEKYSLNSDDFPIPCKWEYVTFVPDVKLSFVEVRQPPSESPAPSDVMKGNIGKFATKVSAEDLLEKSGIKYVFFSALVM